MEMVTIRVAEETLDKWKWDCVQLLIAHEPEALMDIMRELGKQSTMELPAEETISRTLEHLRQQAMTAPLHSSQSGRGTD